MPAEIQRKLSKQHTGLKETGAYVVAFTKKEGKLGKLVDVAIESPGERLDQSYLLFNFFILKYLNNRGNFLNIQNLQTR